MKSAACGETSPWSYPERSPRRWLAANSGYSSPETWRWATPHFLAADADGGPALAGKDREGPGAGVTTSLPPIPVGR